MRNIQTPILIVGAGPVGLSAAIDLAWREIPTIIVEMRHRGEPPVVKCNHVSSRSMETMRRLGLAETIRKAGLPSDFPNDVAFLTTALGTEFARIPIPSVDQRACGDVADYPDGNWPTPEPPHRINQLFLEPILFEHAAAQKQVTILNRTLLESVSQTEQKAIATVRDLDSGESYTITADYLVGCDGARSVVRKGIGARFEGNPQIARNLSSHIRAPGLLDMMRAKRKLSWMSHAINPRRSGNVIAIDGKECWLVHCRMKDEEADFASVDRDRAIRTVLGVDDTFEFEVLAHEDWVARRLVADKMRDGRIFICGDAAHIWIPVAGYGMNCGIADAMNLTWKLAAIEKGWAPSQLLDSFEAERHPITEQVSHFVADLGMSLTPRRNKPPAGIDEESPEGAAVRADFGREMYDMNVSQYCCAGLNFGYFYDQSPIIAYDGEDQPAYTMGTFNPSTVPGCRVPHFWLKNGRSLYDLLGADYTLLRFDPTIDIEPFVLAARAARLPLHVVELQGEGAEIYHHSLVICRPDQHVAWRGQRVPDDADALAGMLAGHRQAVAELAGLSRKEEAGLDRLAEGCP